jgi:adenine-specific DNA-methyltransferase
MKMANKLELTWYGKDKPIIVEPRLLIEDASRSNCSADPETENMLIHGDNLLALKALESKYTGQVKCIYIEMKTPRLIQFNYSSAVFVA